MARPLRVEFSGGLYHVTARGNGRLPIFIDDPDRERFLAVLAAVVARYQLLCHGYCKSDPISLDTISTTMMATKEAEHARQAAEGDDSSRE